MAEAVGAHAAGGSVERAAVRIRAGLSVDAAAVEHGVALSAGRHQQLAGVSEIVGVGTLPSARHRGLALGVTAALVADARWRERKPSSCRQVTTTSRESTLDWASAGPERR
ncbi:hypothetical protein ACFXC9_07260 [Streptomyces naganishii]|uniref:hypothetical protein n=1 Tax=Streptomyces naganishii TaxID=285447 RepID=UPI0036928F18